MANMVRGLSKHLQPVQSAWLALASYPEQCDLFAWANGVDDAYGEEYGNRQGHGGGAGAVATVVAAPGGGAAPGAVAGDT